MVHLNTSAPPFNDRAGTGGVGLRPRPPEAGGVLGSRDVTCQLPAPGFPGLLLRSCPYPATSAGERTAGRSGRASQGRSWPRPPGQRAPMGTPSRSCSSPWFKSAAPELVRTLKRAGLQDENRPRSATRPSTARRCSMPKRTWTSRSWARQPDYPAASGFEPNVTCGDAGELEPLVQRPTDQGAHRQGCGRTSSTTRRRHRRTGRPSTSGPSSRRPSSRSPGAPARTSSPSARAPTSGRHGRPGRCSTRSGCGRSRRLTVGEDDRVSGPVLEHAFFHVSPDDAAAFEDGFATRRLVIAAAARLPLGGAAPRRRAAGTYLLLVEWDTLEDHQAFRASDAFPSWRAPIQPFFAADPEVEHFTSVVARTP